MQQLKNKASEETKHTKRCLRCRELLMQQSGSCSIHIHRRRATALESICRGKCEQNRLLWSVMKPVAESFYADELKRRRSSRLFTEAKREERYCVRCISLARAPGRHTARKRPCNLFVTATVYVWHVDKTRGLASVRQ